MRHPQWGDVAVRLPARAIESNANDPRVDTGELLRHEALAYSVLAASDVPVPALYDLRHYDVDVLICEYVESDGAGCGSADLGEIIARLHAAPIPAGLAPERSSRMFRATIAERVARRWSALRDLTPGLGALPAAGKLAALIPEPGAGSLLHLDVRAPNVLAAGGRVKALIDWTNSIVGDPALELARTVAYTLLPENGIDHEQFVAGYRRVRPLPERSAACWNLYHLDVAVMLAIVFTCEAPDAGRASLMLTRARHHAEQLALPQTPVGTPDPARRCTLYRRAVRARRTAGPAARRVEAAGGR